MKVTETIEKEISVDWEKIYTLVKTDYEEWVHHNIVNNVNPLDQNIDAITSLDLIEHFGDNVESYLEKIGIQCNLNDQEWDDCVEEFEKYINNKK